MLVLVRESIGVQDLDNVPVWVQVTQPDERFGRGEGSPICRKCRKNQLLCMSLDQLM